MFYTQFQRLFEMELNPFSLRTVDKIATMGYNIKNAAIYDKSNKVDLEISIRLQIIVHTSYSEKNTSSWKQDSLS